MRLFLALNLPPDARRAAHAATEPLRAAAPCVAWAAAEKLHLTVKFLGEQPAQQVEPLVAELAPVAAQHAAATLVIGGVGAFPRLRRPRVLWLGVHPDPKLELLHHDVETACARLGHPVNGRPFRPHVTLGRVTPRTGVLDAATLADAARGVHFRTTVVASTLDVMLSEPAQGRTRHTPLARLPLVIATPTP